jgi:hypothetical protein
MFSGGRLMYEDSAHWIMNGRASTFVPVLGILALAIGMVIWVWVGFHPPAQELAHSDTQSAAEKWLVANVPPESRVAADTFVASDLVRAGLTRPQPVDYIQICSSDGSLRFCSWRDVDYLVSTPLTRSDSTILSPLKQALASSIAVAIFGKGPRRIEVRQILPPGIGVGDVRRWRSADEQARQWAEAALLHNRRVQVAVPAARVLEAGGLDLRAATVLALMADQGLLQVDAIDSDPAETAAGLPARTVEITVRQRTLVADTVRNLPTDYRPRLVQTLGPTRSQLTWPIAAAPVMPAT